MARKDYLASSRKIKRKRLIVKVSFCALTVVLFLSAVVALFNIPYLQAEKVEIGGNHLVSNEEVTVAILDKIQGKRLLFLPEKNIFLIPKEEIESSLPQEIRRIKNISLNPNFPDKIEARITERENRALFCREEECAFMDEEAFVFEKAPYFSGAIFLKFFDQRTGATSSPFAIGSYLLNLEDFTMLMDFSRLAARKGFEMTEVYLKPENIFEIVTKEGWKIILNGKNEADKTLANLITTLESGIREKRKDLDYIDLRFGNKVYFKFK